MNSFKPASDRVLETSGSIRSFLDDSDENEHLHESYTPIAIICAMMVASALFAKRPITPLFLCLPNSTPGSHNSALNPLDVMGCRDASIQ